MFAPDEGTPLVLVPSSPLCGHVLAAAGFQFSAVESPIMDEPWGLSCQVGPVQRAEALAYFRARSVSDRRPGAMVLAATTLVVVGDRVFGAPFGRREAGEMLHTVSGKRHAVVTGVALVHEARRLLASETTFVTMRAIPEGEIASYLASGNWLGVAGAYATPEIAGRFVTHLEGSFSNLLGLPVELVVNMLARIDSRCEAYDPPLAAASA